MIKNRDTDINTFIFDIGNVMIKCGSIYLLKDWLNLSDTKSQELLSTALHPSWIAELDLGKPFDIAVKERIKCYPEHKEYILNYANHWDKTIDSIDDKTIEIINNLISNNYKIYALSNWPAEKYYLLKEMLPILHKFDGVIISGNIGIKKPSPKIFDFIIDKYNIQPQCSIFIDDLDENILSAKKFGFNTHKYNNSENLHNYLTKKVLYERN